MFASRRCDRPQTIRLGLIAVEANDGSGSDSDGLK